MNMKRQTVKDIHLKKGMSSNDLIKELYQSGVITYDVALSKAKNPEEFRQL